VRRIICATTTDSGSMRSRRLPCLYLSRSTSCIGKKGRLTDRISVLCQVLLLVWLNSINCCLAKDSQTRSRENLTRIHQIMLHHVDAGDYQAALPLAIQIVDLVRRTRPASESEQAASLFSLAVVQRHLGHVRKSERNFKDSIKIYERIHGRQSPGLISRLKQLGRLYYQMGEYTESLGTLKRAQHIIQREDGVYSINQLPIVDAISRILAETNRIEEAGQQQKFYYTINKVSYGEQDPRMIPVLSKLGHWLKRSMQHKEALRVFQEKLDLVTELGADSDVELLEPLLEIALMMYLSGSCCPRDPVNRAAAIVSKDPSIDTEDKIRVMLELGDMSLLTRQMKDAANLYSEVWNLMNIQGDSERKAKEFFAVPVLLGVSSADDAHKAYSLALRPHYRSLPNRTTIYPLQTLETAHSTWSASVTDQAKRRIGVPLSLCSNHVLNLAHKRRVEDLSEIQISFQFSVDVDGQVFDASVVDGKAPSRLQKYVLAILYNTRFRPRLVNGDGVATKRLNLNQSFPGNPQQNGSVGSPIDSGAYRIGHTCLAGAVAGI